MSERSARVNISLLDAPVRVRPKPDRRGSARGPGSVRAGRVPRILLVDDHSAMRQGLAMVLEAEGVGNCSQAGGLAEALAITSAERPDIALVGLSTDPEAGLSVLHELRARRIPVLVCSMCEAAPSIRRALEAGARGYLTKCEAPQSVARAVRGVLDGWMLVSPRAVESLEE